MKSRLVTALGLAVVFLIFCVPMFAHHGGSEYDQEHPKTLKGTVTQYYWANPHCQIFLDVKGGDGKIVHWGIETFAPAVLKRAGWNPHTLHPGEVITVTFVPSKRGNPIGMLRKAVLPDGKVLTGGQIGE